VVGFGMKKLLLAAIISAFLAPHAGQADQAEVRRGAVFVENHCARCHATGTASESPLANAPPFRTLHRRYPIESLEEALGEGIRTGHRTMPEFQLDQKQILDLIVYLRSLE
jgi:cytochrome c